MAATSTFLPPDYIPRQHGSCSDRRCIAAAHRAILPPENLVQDSRYLYVRDALRSSFGVRHIRISKWYSDDLSHPACFPSYAGSRIEVVHNAILRAVSMQLQREVDPLDVNIQLVNDRMTRISIGQGAGAVNISGDVPLLPGDGDFLFGTAQKTAHAAMKYLYDQVLAPQHTASPRSFVPGMVTAVPAAPPRSSPTPLSDGDGEAISSSSAAPSSRTASKEEGSPAPAYNPFEPDPLFDRTLPAGAPQGDITEQLIQYMDAEPMSWAEASRQADLQILKKEGQEAYHSYSDLRAQDVPPFHQALSDLSQNFLSREETAGKVRGLLHLMHRKAYQFWLKHAAANQDTFAQFKKERGGREISEEQLRRAYFWIWSAKHLILHLKSIADVESEPLIQCLVTYNV